MNVGKIVRENIDRTIHLSLATDYPDIDALGYASTNSMAEKVRVKLSEATKL